MQESEMRIIEEKKNKELQTVYDKAFNEGIFYEREKSNQRIEKMQKDFNTKNRWLESDLKKKFNKSIDDLKEDLPIWAYLMPRKLLDKLKVKN